MVCFDERKTPISDRERALTILACADLQLRSRAFKYV